MMVQQLQQDRPARRLYVGNLPVTATEKDVEILFNQAITSVVERASMPHAKYLPKPVKAVVNTNRQKSYTFIEFCHRDDAAIAVSLDGIRMHGCTLAVRRPKEFLSSPFAKEPQRVFNVPGIISSNVPDGPDKVFIGQLPKHLSAEDVQAFVGTFGKLKAFNLCMDTATATSRGFAFFAYQDSAITADAVKGLHGIELGGQKVVCQHSGQPAGNVAGQLAALLALPQIVAGVPGAASGVVASATRILVMQNMVVEEDLADPEEYDDIVADVREECSKYGEVLDVVIPRLTKPGCGKVFVAYKTKEMAQAAEASIAGRKFANRTILTTYLSEEKYQAGDFA